MYYNEDYFNWQKSIGAFGGIANLFKFAPYLSPDDTVIDFGCGGGYLLNNIQCAGKIGIEISDTAREEAQKHGLIVYKNIEDVPDDYASIMISNHTLEHVECPLDIIRALRPKLKSGGKAVFVVPHQQPEEKYHDSDINQHLYTWNPMTLGNLFKNAGYVDIRADVIRHKWPKGYRRIYQMVGQTTFDTICHINALIVRNYQIRVVAKKQ